jgi:hypothetical protein
VIVPGEGEHWYTISTSALALLRTLESNHSREEPVADRLILCCGMIEMLTCPIGIDWSVTHLNGRVRLDDIVRYDSVDETEALQFDGLTVELAESVYRRQIAGFAEAAKQPWATRKRLPTTTNDSSMTSSGASTTGG